MSRKVKKGRRWAQWRRWNEPIESIMVVEHVRPDPALAAPRRLAKYDAIVAAMNALRDEGFRVQYAACGACGEPTGAVRRQLNGLHAQRAQLEQRRQALATAVLKQIRINDWVEKPVYSTLDVRFPAREETGG